MNVSRVLLVASVVILGVVGACTVTRTVDVTPHNEEVNEPARLTALYRRILDSDCDAKQLAFNFCATQHNLLAIFERSMTLANLDALDVHLNTLPTSDSKTELVSVLLDLRKALQ